MVQYLKEVMLGQHTEIKTVADWFDKFNIPYEARSDFAFAAALNQIKLEEKRG